MSILKRFALVVVAAFATGPASAQTAIVFTEAELAVPFGSAKGHIALVGDTIVFVTSDASRWSMAIEHAEIAKAQRNADVVTITTQRPLKDADGERDSFRFRLAEPARLMGWYEATPSGTGPATTGGRTTKTDASPILASYQVRHDHRIGSCQGTLILTEGGVSFESNNQLDDSRQWELIDIKKVGQDGTYKLKIEPFFGSDFNFELNGIPMDGGVYRSLVDRIARARIK